MQGRVYNWWWRPLRRPYKDWLERNSSRRLEKKDIEMKAAVEEAVTDSTKISEDGSKES
jgi:hypothetical protein